MVAKVKNKINKKHPDIIAKMWEDHYDFMLDSMWMSYRYCIGRHTIAAHYRAGEIAKYCYGHISDERSIFNAYDINREIEDKLRFCCGIEFNFPLTSLNKIYTSAIDIWYQFIEDYHITTKEEYLKYKSVDIILYDNERGYKFETTTWEEWIEATRNNIIQKYSLSHDITDDELSTYDKYEDVNYYFNTLKRRPKADYFFLMDVEDLFVWNDLVHLFDIEHHYQVELIDGTIQEVFDTYIGATNDAGYVIPFKYKKIICPAISESVGITRYIPKENIKRIVE